MPPRKSDAASRKSNAGASSEAAAAEVVNEPTETRPSTADVAVGEPQAAEAGAAPEAEAAAEAEGPASTTGDAPATPAKDKDAKSKSHHSDAVTIEDLNMPRSIVTRLAKSVLPPTTQLQGSAITAMTKSATVFISHLANAANTLTTDAGKKTIMPADVFAALDDIEFGFLKEQLEAEYAKFNQIQTSKRTDYRKRVAAAKKGPDGQDDQDQDQDQDHDGEADKDGADSATADAAPSARDAPPQAKKAKRAHGGKAAGAGAAEDEDAELDEEHEHEHEEHEEQEHEEHEEEDDEEEEEEEEEEDDDDVDEGDDEEAADMEDDDEALDSDDSE